MAATATSFNPNDALFSLALPSSSAGVQLDQLHPFNGMHFDSDEDELEDDGAYDDGDDDYIDEDDSFQGGVGAPIPPPIPTHSRPTRPDGPKPNPSLPVANARSHGGLPLSRSIILPARAPPKIGQRPIRKLIGATTPALVSSTRPSNVKKAGAPAHRATLSIASTGIDPTDPSIPDPNEEGIIMVSGAQALQLTFLDFTPNMFLIRRDLTDPLYPAQLEPPSKLTPLRCLCCKKIYNGPNARSMWRRHITQKHQFTLGGKKGNGKGKKEYNDGMSWPTSYTPTSSRGQHHPDLASLAEDSMFPGETAEQAAMRRREMSLQAKRDWARNRRLQDKTSASYAPRPAAMGGALPPPFFPQVSFPMGHLPSLPSSYPSVADLGMFQGDQSLQELSESLGLSAVGAPMMQVVASAASQAGASYQDGAADADEDDEEDIPLATQAASQVQVALAPAPTLHEGIAIESAAADGVDDAAPAVPQEPELVANEVDDEPLASQTGLRSIAHFSSMASDFEFDYDALSTSPVVAMNNSVPAISDAHSIFYSHSSVLRPSTPNPSAPLSRHLSDEEKRQMILSLESPTSYPFFARSKTSAVLPRLDSTPGRPSAAMHRSHTMPVLPMSGGGPSSSVSTDTIESLFVQTPIRGSGLSGFDMFPSPSQAVAPVMSWAFDSPVLKRKRNHTEGGGTVLSSTTPNVNSGDVQQLTSFDFDSWFDLNKSPGKAFSGSSARGSENQQENVRGGGENGRAAKRVKVEI